jgi:hypothetical protein
VKFVVQTCVAALLFLLGTVAAGSAPYVIGYDETKSLLVNQTMVTYDPGHGTQVEFIAKNGRTYLLYPGNKIILQGEWKLNRTKKPKVFDLCFRYPENSYNPVTGDKGGSWSCQPAGFYLAVVVDHAKGDVLGLSKQQAVPFVLSKRKTTLANLLGKLR